MEFLKNHIQFTDIALQDLKRIFPKLSSLNPLFSKIIGIAKVAKRAQKIRPKDYDFCFKLHNKRAYLHCKLKSNILKKSKTLFLVVSVNEV